MKQTKLTQQQETILQEIKEIVLIGEEKLKTFQSQSQAISDKWKTWQQQNKD